MGRIVILPAELASKIAAGEVVERPASVVKELVENCLDAGSTRIACAVEKGGKDLVRVSDNGSGMSRDDALLAVKRHATSKLRSLEDLMNVSTFGFRGEALPSIASVSRMEIVTRTSEDMAGTMVEVQGGEVTKVSEVGCPSGTSVAVTDLFYNVPARKKFMKTTQTELYHMVNGVTCLALSNPGVAFSLAHDGHTLLEVPAVGDLTDRALALFGLGFVKSCARLGGGDSLIRIEGFVSRPEELGSTRSRQLVFVNKRPVASRSLVHAVYQAFGLEGRDRHPHFILLIEVQPNAVDVNVHPTKREIRFTDEKAVHDLVADSVRRAINPDAGTDLQRRPPMRAPGISRDERPLLGIQESLAAYEAAGAGVPEERTEVIVPEFWQLHKTYIVAQTKTGMIIVDQHTAHERVIYEEILKNRKGAASQQLLFPRPVELPPQEAVLLEERMDEIQRLGFQIAKYSGNTYVIEAVPAYLTGYRDETFAEFVHEMHEAGRARAGSFDEMAKMLACKAAVKAGQPLSSAEMNSLVDRLFATESPFFCPHGRPTVVRMSMEELARRFGRI